MSSDSTTDIDKRDQQVLDVLVTGRANPMLIRERTDLHKSAVSSALARLGKRGYVEQVTHGLYKITEKGRKRVEDYAE